MDQNERDYLIDKISNVLLLGKVAGNLSAYRALRNYLDQLKTPSETIHPSRIPYIHDVMKDFMQAIYNFKTYTNAN